jgi:hypothetical protein
VLDVSVTVKRDSDSDLYVCLGHPFDLSSEEVDVQWFSFRREPETYIILKSLQDLTISIGFSSLGKLFYFDAIHIPLN